MRNVSEQPSPAIVDHIPIVGVLMLLLLPMLVCVCVLMVPMLVVFLLAMNDCRRWYVCVCMCVVFVRVYVCVCAGDQ